MQSNVPGSPETTREWYTQNPKACKAAWLSSVFGLLTWAWKQQETRTELRIIEIMRFNINMGYSEVPPALCLSKMCKRLTKVALPKREKCFSTAGRNCRLSSPLSRLQKGKRKLVPDWYSTEATPPSIISSNIPGDGEVGICLFRLSSGAVLQRLQQGKKAGAARRLRRRHHYNSPPQGLFIKETQKAKLEKKKAQEPCWEKKGFQLNLADFAEAFPRNLMSRYNLLTYGQKKKKKLNRWKSTTTNH